MSDSRSCGRCIYYNSIINECGEEPKCMRDVDEAKYTSYIEGKKQGRVEALKDTELSERANMIEELKSLLRCRNYRGCAAGKGCDGVCSIDSDICKSCENFGIPYSLLAEWQKK